MSFRFSQPHAQDSGTPPQVPPPPTQPARRFSLATIHKGELPVVLLSAAQFFFLLSSYFMLRPIREALGIERSFDDLKWLMTATMVAMLAINPLYALLVSKLPRRRFIPITNRFFALNLLAFAAWFFFAPNSIMGWSLSAGAGTFGLFAAPTTLGGFAFYIWLSVFNLFVVSVFWAFMADAHGRERSRRVYGLVAVGGTLGAIAGAAFTNYLTKGIPLGSVTLKLDHHAILIAAVIALEASTQCMKQVARRARNDADSSTMPTSEPSPGIMQGLTLLAKNKYLALIAGYVLIYAITSTLLSLEQSRMISEAYPDKAARTEAFANLEMLRQSAALLVQVFLTANIVRWIGLSATLTILPIVTLAGFIALQAHPALAVLMWFQVIRHATHHALDRPAREMLYTAVGPDERYKSKPFIDTFIYRGGDVIGTWLPTALKSLGSATILPAAIVATLAWAAIAITTGRLNKRRPTRTNDA